MPRAGLERGGAGVRRCASGRVSQCSPRARRSLPTARRAEFGFARATGDWRAARRPTRRSTSCRSPRPTSSTPTWRSRRSRPASMSGARSRWRRTLADAERMLAAARASGKVAALGYNYIQNPMIRLIRTLLDEGTIGDGQPCPHRDGRGLHGRSGGAVLLEERGVIGPWRARRFRRASAEPDLSFCSAAFAASARTWRSPMRTARCTDGGRRAVETYDIATMLIDSTTAPPA